MYYTTLTVMVGFSLLTLSNFTPSLYFGPLTDLAMLAAVLALLLLPKLILVVKPWVPAAMTGLFNAAVAAAPAVNTRDCRALFWHARW